MPCLYDAQMPSEERTSKIIRERVVWCKNIPTEAIMEIYNSSYLLCALLHGKWKLVTIVFFSWHFHPGILEIMIEQVMTVY